MSFLYLNVPKYDLISFGVRSNVVRRNDGRREGTKVTQAALSFEDLSKLEVFTLDEFCRWARLSRASAYRCIKDGQLVAVKLRSRTMIRRDDALNFIGRPPE